MRTRTPRRMLNALALALVASVVPTAALAPAAAHCGGETYVLEDLQLWVKAKKPSYSIGDTAMVEVTVRRPADHDPLGQGIDWGEPPYSEPAANINVGIGVQVNDVFLPGYNITNEQGIAIVPVKIEPWTRPGTAMASILAWNKLHENPCLTIEEQGYTAHPKLFKVKP